MLNGSRLTRVVLLCTLAGDVGHALAQDCNIRYPIAEIEAALMAPELDIREVRRARSQLETDIAKRGVLRTDRGHEFEIKVRPAMPDGSRFNNEPRYELAAYRLQAMFLEPRDYVVPPTAIRSLPLDHCRRYAPEIQPTFRKADDVIVVVQYWLQNVSSPPDVLDEDRLSRDPRYARHIGNLNALTFVIEHADANQGNFLVSEDPANPRVFAVDNGVAFASLESDRSLAWMRLRVARMSKSTIDRLRAITREALENSLGVVAEFRIDDGRLVERAPTEPVGRLRGVRIKGDVVQFGLTHGEIGAVYRRIRQLVSRYDKGKIQPLDDPEPDERATGCELD